MARPPLGTSVPLLGSVGGGFWTGREVVEGVRGVGGDSLDFESDEADFGPRAGVPVCRVLRVQGQ